VLHVLSNVHTVLLEEQINWSAHLKVTSWVLKKTCIPWNPKVMLQFVQYSDGDGKLRESIIGNFYFHTFMMLYWGIWLYMWNWETYLETKTIDDNWLCDALSEYLHARQMLDGWELVQSTHHYGWCQMQAKSLLQIQLSLTLEKNIGLPRNEY
jgi:hypothetical protein